MESKDNTDAPSERGVDVDIDEMIRKEQDASTGVLSAQVKGLDANRYATKKTVAQGMLDIALLTSNASQLKYVLQVGPKHEFYTLLVVLISVSIVLQVAMGLVLLSLNLLRDCRFHEPRHRVSAHRVNYATTASAFVVTVLNVLVSAFDSSLARYLEIDYAIN
ncbi:ninjurin-2 isoform X4 [Leguminivora glycinivorella]|uniref:ninjurin-2 isoform X4 n=1 Tax=Leguminivora glycinivorella TaxID=1035111 RepID=UPI00200F81C5|nr:ninjurin-2 isoform X4 [Leguminivora glycinivorella]